MKSIRQKRIEDDNNKEWAQIKIKSSKINLSLFPVFDNTATGTIQGWKYTAVNEPTLYCYFNRGDSMDDKKYEKATEDHWGNMEFFAYYCYFYYKSYEAAFEVLDITDQGPVLNYANLWAFAILGGFFLTAQTYTSDKRIESLIKNHKNPEAISFLYDATKSMMEMIPYERAKKLGLELYETVLGNILYWNNMSEYYELVLRPLKGMWNQFIVQCEKDLNKINTEGYYDEDDVWHWKYSACWVKHTFTNISAITSFRSSTQKIFKNNKLLRGRYNQSHNSLLPLEFKIENIIKEEELIEE